jgi:DNA repair protein RecO
MHTVHHTEAVILKSTAHGEANKRVWLFTESFGLIVATVQGVRNKGAKLQSHIIDYAFIHADLVQGKEVWRLVSARLIDAPLAGRLRSPLARAYVRSLSLVTRFLIDEGVHEELYAHIKACAQILKEGTADPQLFDALSIWKMLVFLGYIAPEPDELALVSLPIDTALLQISAIQHKALLSEVKDALIQSHL